MMMEQNIAQAAQKGELIRANGLRKVYTTDTGDKVLALKEVDFSIRDGEFISIVGPSGCGKSTLLKIMAGLLGYSAGNISISGRSIKGPHHDVGVVFQAPVLLPWRTILQNVLLPSEFRGRVDKKVQARARELLALVGLSGFENRYPHELSGGMQQRASIVRALVQDPKLLLMDEPFGALDALTRDQMNVELLKLWSHSPKTIIFITHSIAEAVFLSDRVFVMTPRPGKLDEIIEVDLPRPRALSMVNTDAFGVYAGRIRKLLHASEDIAG
ncbi:ABC transporter ATP-binding protein [Mesorhizobium sp. YR577]|uniref:ABC transporter ATP-binding protein n=1 Tax=Mesorhizobium sp. YR577 TaxID=1884373 RepID=UPI0008E705A6|nr:ABC transporter ATP-binding protein [Mesorhizobium sp. YR577]SFU22374.1 NitT/TauT family transport system ATP-binding protein [Mesorhizobium sp. YR577]